MSTGSDALAGAGTGAASGSVFRALGEQRLELLAELLWVFSEVTKPQAKIKRP